MSILFAGGETADFDEVLSGMFDTTNTTVRDLSYTRSAMRSGQVRKWFTPVSEVWVRATWAASTLATTANNTMWNIRSGTDPIVRVRGVTSGVYHFQRWDGAAWVDVGDTWSGWSSFSPTAVMFYVKIAEEGRLEFWAGGALISSWDGDTSAMGEPDNVLLGATTGGAGSYTGWSECIIATHDLLAARLNTLAITGDGAQSDWVGAYTDINAMDSPDNSFISSEEADEVSTFVINDLAEDSLEVDAVVVSGRFRRNDEGPTNIDALVRHDGTNYGQSFGDIETYFKSAQRIFAVNPATSAPWAKADVNALEIGVESKE